MHRINLYVVSLLAWGSAIVLTVSASAQPPANKPRVVVSRVVTREVIPTVRVVGSVKPLKSSIIGSAVAGRVVEIDIDQGVEIKAEDCLAQLRTDTLELERLAANAELELAQQQLAELQNGARPEEIAEAEATAMGAKSAMENSANALRRFKSLTATGAATASDLEAATERATMARYTYEAAEAVKKRIMQGPRVEQIAQAEARLELQRQNVAMIDDRIKKHRIISPFDGFISAKFTEVGAWINAGDPIAEVIALDEVEIVAPVTADVATNLVEGAKVQVEFSEIPDRTWLGQVHRVVPVADARSRTYPVIVRLRNERLHGRPQLLSGMLARVDMPAGIPVKLPVIPKDALVLNEAVRTVYVVESEQASERLTAGKVRQVPVELGVAEGGMIQVKGGLKDGDFVVVLGNERLRPNADVEVIEIREYPTLSQGAPL